MQDFYIATNNLLPEKIDLYRRLGQVQRLQMTDQYKAIHDTTTMMTDQFSNTFASVITGQQTFGDAMKSMWTNLADQIISEILRVAVVKPLMSAAETGATSLLNWVGSLALQEGGVFDKPTPAIIGEAGPEAVVPLKGGKIPIEGGEGGNYAYNHYVNNIYAIDGKSFADQVRRNPGIIVEVIGQNVRRGGHMKDIIRGA